MAGLNPDPFVLNFTKMAQFLTLIKPAIVLAGGGAEP